MIPAAIFRLHSYDEVDFSPHSYYWRTTFENNHILPPTRQEIAQPPPSQRRLFLSVRQIRIYLPFSRSPQTAKPTPIKGEKLKIDNKLSPIYASKDKENIPNNTRTNPNSIFFIRNLLNIFKNIFKFSELFAYLNYIPLAQINQATLSTHFHRPSFSGF